MSGVLQHLSFCVWIVSLSLMSWRLILVVARVNISFLFQAESYCTVGTDHVLFICSSVSGHLSCFHFYVSFNYARIHLSEGSLEKSGFDPGAFQSELRRIGAGITHPLGWEKTAP